MDDERDRERQRLIAKVDEAYRARLAVWEAIWARSNIGVIGDEHWASIEQADKRFHDAEAAVMEFLRRPRR